MKIPEGMTEDQVITIINKAIKGLCSKFRFGYFEKEDLEQEGWVFAIKALNKYNGSAPLENFLRVHIRNRFMNLKRNKYSRFEPPCLQCPFYDPKCEQSTNKCSEFENKDDCHKWAAWKKRNAAKSGLMKPVNIESVTEDELQINNEFINSMNLSAIYKKINERMSVELRGDFLRMLDGIYLPKQRKDKVREFIKEMGVFDELKGWYDK